MTANVSKQNTNFNPAVQQISPDQTFGVYTNPREFPRQPLYDTELFGTGSVDLSFFRPKQLLVLDPDKFRKARTRSVRKLVEWDLVAEALLTEVPDTRAMASPAAARAGRVDSGDVILGLDHDKKPTAYPVLATRPYWWYRAPQAQAVVAGHTGGLQLCQTSYGDLSKQLERRLS